MLKERRGPAGGKTKEARRAAVPEPTALYVRLYKPVAECPADPAYTAPRVREKRKLSVTVRSSIELNSILMTHHRPWPGPGRCQTLGIPASAALLFIRDREVAQ